MAQTNFPLVSIITVNFNQARVTGELIESLRKISYRNIEIIAIDNASHNDSLSMIQERYPEVTFIKNTKNLGFAGGNNIGICHAKGKYLLFINNDAEVKYDFLEHLVIFLEKHPNAGMVSPKIKYYYQPEIIQYAGYTAMHPVTARNHLIGYKQKDNGQFDEIKQTSYAHGAAMIVPREVINKAGVMPDEYFLYYEELDWAEKIKKAGYNIYYHPKSVVYHKESISTGKESPLMIYYKYRNRILFVHRNFNGLKKVLSLAYLYIIAIPKGEITYLLKGKVNLAWQVLKAGWWNFAH